MKSNFINNVHLEGLLYEHNLTKKVSGASSKNPGTEYITGTISIATDNAGVNVVPIHYSYITAVTSKGKANSTFTHLANIIDGAYKTVVGAGADNAVKLSIDTNIDLNEFYSDKKGQEEFVSVKRNEGGFIHVVNVLNEDEAKRNTFDVDMIITSVTEQEEDTEKGTPAKAILRGTIFQNYTHALLPTEFSIIRPDGIKFFLGQDIHSKNPLFIKLRGSQISETIKRTIEEESAFGDPYVKEVTSTRKDFVINSCGNPQEWDSEQTILATELAAKMTERETYLATLKQRNEEYKSSKNAAAAAPIAKNSDFNF